MIEVKVDGGMICFTAKGSAKKILDESCRVVIAACESLSHKQDDPEGYKQFLLRKAIDVFLDVVTGEKQVNSIIFDEEAAAEERSRTDESD